MKYHGHEIIKVKEDMGYSGDDDFLNYVYKIYKDGEYMGEAWSLNTAKEYIDTGYDTNYL